jgi:hypothetical protein
MVGETHYREQGRPQQDISPVSPPVPGASVHTLPVTPGKTFFPNLKQFPVTAGAAFTLDTTLSAPAAADHAGYVTVIFLDAAGKGMSRENLWFTPSVQPLGRAMTDARGAFSLGCPQMSLRPGRRFAPSGRAAHRFGRPWPFCRGHRLRCEQLGPPSRIVEDRHARARNGQGGSAAS